MNVIEHYDMLIDENNDPFRDPPVLQDYMNQWDGQLFIDSMKLDHTKSVLEIGVGTGRIAAKVAPNCLQFTGIDISPKTIDRAKENLSKHRNVVLICADFEKYTFDHTFDVVYSSLTMMHFEDKKQILSKVAGLLRERGIFCLSIDKNQSAYIDTGTRKIRVYPDTPDALMPIIKETHLHIVDAYETEFAHILICEK
ncbi:MAG: class I SAM-dependent methyltransferase [Clostridia bacterium]|nr:class I SAM-dependent methyltransferase [Clostridia bacterium]